MAAALRALGLACVKARAIVGDLRAARMNTAADLVERSVSETLTYYAFPDIHWQKIRTIHSSGS